MNCKSKHVKYVIYLYIQSVIHVQCVGKSETTFDNCLINRRKEVIDINYVTAHKHFILPGHDFNSNPKCTLIEMLTNTNQATTETLKKILKNRENFWIKKTKST